MRIFFIGCTESSNVLLEALIKCGKNVCGVITKKISGVNSDFVNLNSVAEKNLIPCAYYEKDKDGEMLGFVRRCTPDIIYCFGWSHILKKEILDAAPGGAVGFHPAALPKNRGRHPLIWALALGLDETASTFFMMDSGADSGDIISQRLVTVYEADTARTLYDKVMHVAQEQVVEITDAIENGVMSRVKQDDRQANYWRKRGKKDGEIDFRMDADTVYNLVRALSKPYVGAHFVYEEREYKVWRAAAAHDDGSLGNIEPGKVLEVYSATSFAVKTGHGLLKILECDAINLEKGAYL